MVKVSKSDTGDRQCGNTRLLRIRITIIHYLISSILANSFRDRRICGGFCSGHSKARGDQHPLHYASVFGDSAPVR